MDIYFALYRSKARSHLDADLVSKIVKTSLRNNARDGLTGFLHTDKDHFLQYLEGPHDPLMHRLVPTLVAEMGGAYSELGRAQASIEAVFEQEELRFRRTLGRGTSLLEDATADLSKGDKLDGETAFTLYDTYGFPLDLTQDALREKGCGGDVEGFDAAMAEQKAKARAAWSGTGPFPWASNTSYFCNSVNAFGPRRSIETTSSVASAASLAATPSQKAASAVRSLSSISPDGE